MKAWVALVLLLVPLTASAEMYKWKDNAGREHYSDDLNRIPAEYRDRAVEVTGGTVNRSQTPPASKTSSDAGKIDVNKILRMREPKDKYGRTKTWWRNTARKQLNVCSAARQKKAALLQQAMELRNRMQTHLAMQKAEEAEKTDEEIAYCEETMQNLIKKAKKDGARESWLMED